jgi:hypothetical protein
MKSTYRIVDEPTPSGLERFAVDPLFPLLAAMLAGTWLAWPWFAWNAAALSSATRRKEWLLCLGYPVVWCTATAVLAFSVERYGPIPDRILPYVPIAFTAVRLVFGYLIQLLQADARELFEYFGGRVRNGLPVLLVGMFLVRPRIVDLARDESLGELTRLFFMGLL